MSVIKMMNATHSETDNKLRLKRTGVAFKLGEKDRQGFQINAGALKSNECLCFTLQWTREILNLILLEVLQAPTEVD